MAYLVALVQKTCAFAGGCYKTPTVVLYRYNGERIAEFCLEHGEAMLVEHNAGERIHDKS